MTKKRQKLALRRRKTSTFTGKNVSNIKLVICHGGQLVKDRKKTSYVGGTEVVVEKNVDIKSLNYLNIISHVHFLSNGRPVDLFCENAIGLFFQVVDDRLFFELCGLLHEGDTLKLYVVNHNVGEQNVVEHSVAKHSLVEHNVVGEGLEKGVLEGGLDNLVEEGLEVYHEAEFEGVAADQEADEQGFEADHEAEFEGAAEEGGFDQGATEDDYHQTFDDICVNVEGLTDDEEEELQEARDKVRASRKKRQTINLENAEGVAEEGSDIISDGNDRDYVDESDKTAENNAESDGNDSVYYNSSELGSYESLGEEAEDDEQIMRKSNTNVHFDPTTRIPIFSIGMKFQSIEQVRDAVARYTVLKGLRVHLVKNDTRRVRAECKEGCPWVLQFSPHSADNNWTLKTYRPHHRCDRTNKCKLMNTAFLVKYFRARIISQPYIKLRELRALVRSELKQKVTLNMCRATKRQIMEELMGSYKEEYALLHDYAAVIKQTNPGTTCFAHSCSTDNLEGKPLFSMFYVCLEACKRGWIDGCRKIIGIDGCFLKGICKGQLLCAVGRDGNNQMFPIAWGVVELETKTTWTWFLKSLVNDLSLGDGEGYTFISDMQKGLESAMQDLLPNAEHRRCARHVYANWAKHWRGGERKLAFWNCAKATYGGELRKRLEVLDGLGNEIVQAALSYGIRQWCKVYFDTSIKCDVVDNNLAETFNGWILEARGKSIITMLEDIRVLVMNRIWTKRDSANTWIMDISPKAMDKLEKNKTLSHDWEMDWNGDHGYEVQYVFDKDDKHTVDLDTRTCTCREWDLTGIPCRHAVCAIYYKSDTPEHFVHHYYSKETYLKSYANTIQPVPGKLHWVTTELERIEPPEFKKKPGRPKRCRRKDKDEIKKTGKLGQSGRKMTCSHCREGGHNVRRCPNRRPGEEINIRKNRKRLKVAESTQDGGGTSSISQSIRPARELFSSVDTHFCSQPVLQDATARHHTTQSTSRQHASQPELRVDVNVARPTRDKAPAKRDGKPTELQLHKDKEYINSRFMPKPKWNGNLSISLRQLQKAATSSSRPIQTSAASTGPQTEPATTTRPNWKAFW